MKQDVMPSIVRIDQETLKKLTTEVKETVASGYSVPAAKSVFTSANLWNIHRNWKTASRLSDKWGIQ
jgi:hypothetical protein